MKFVSVFQLFLLLVALNIANSKFPSLNLGQILPKPSSANQTLIPSFDSNLSLDSILPKLLFWLFNFMTGSSGVSVAVPPDLSAEIAMDPTLRIQMYGYPAENHTARTVDGYLLKVHRIPNNDPDAIPILLIHGLSCASTLFIHSQEHSPAFQLFENNYDVWIGNLRGGPYTSHVNLTKSDKEFWNYSFEDMANYDIPSMIDLVLKKTGKKKLIYLGHSMGSIVGFCFFSSHPEYNHKVASYMAVSPVPNIRYGTALGFPIIRAGEILMVIAEAAGKYTFLDLDPTQLQAVLQLCSNTENYESCELYQSIICGWDPYFHNQTRLPVFIADTSIGTSTKNVKHLAQINRLNGLYRFDYGAIENQKRYGSPNPPKFDISRIKVPTYIYYGANDPPSDAMDVELAIQNMPSLVKVQLSPVSMYAHLDGTDSNISSQHTWDYVMNDIEQIWVT